MLDLLSARNTRRDDLDIRRLRQHGGRQTSLAQSYRNVVMLFLESEGTRHSATARICFNDFKISPSKNGDSRADAHHSFLMTVAVKQRSPRAFLKIQGEAFGSFLQEKLFEQEA